ncbi:MAG: hypothetical protein CVT69_00465 [Actinobacteria bacterium HGW-Actinobacteria-9]|nr:MAG: hypothetical protein CVT69_00465 [Actinobacteria bacterium HGW-Actinobacteria-9]
MVADPPASAEGHASAIVPALSDVPLDRAHIKRAWPAVLAEFRKLKPSRAGAFANTEVDVDGATMVIEFPADAALVVPSQPETREVLSRAMGIVLGGVPPFRYQQGRGAVVAVTGQETATTPAAREPVPDEPIGGVSVVDAVSGQAQIDPEPTVTPAGGAITASDTAAAPDTGDLDEIMRTQFGAEMVAEHPHGSGDGKDGE